MARRSRARRAAVPGVRGAGQGKVPGVPRARWDPGDRADGEAVVVRPGAGAFSRGYRLASEAELARKLDVMTGAGAGAETEPLQESAGGRVVAERHRGQGGEADIPGAFQNPRREATADAHVLILVGDFGSPCPRPPASRSAAPHGRRPQTSRRADRPLRSLRARRGRCRSDTQAPARSARALV